MFTIVNVGQKNHQTGQLAADSATQIPLQELQFSWLYNQHDLLLKSLVPGQYAGFISVQTCESDTTEFVAPGAVVLTLGHAFRDKPTGWHDWVAQLAAAGARGIGFGEEIVFQTAPAELIAACKDAQLELFLVGRTTAFAQIMGTVQQELIRRATAQHDQLAAWQEQLSREAARGGLKQLVAVAARLLQAGIAIADNDGRLAANTPYDDFDAAPELAAEIAAGRLQSRAQVTGESYQITQRMLTHGERFHLLLALRDRPFSHLELSAIKHTAGLADMLLQRPELLRKARGELNALAIALLLGIQNHGEIAPLLRNVTDRNGQIRPLLLQGRPQIIDTAVAELDRHFAKIARDLFALRLAPTRVLVLFQGNRVQRSILSALTPNTQEKLVIALHAAIPWQQLGPDLVHNLELAAAAAPAGTVIASDAVGLTWLRHQAVTPLLQQRYEQTWGRITEPVLVDTLEAFLKNSSNHTLTSEALAVHRQTLRKRLRGIAALLDLNLADPTVCAELLLLRLAQQSNH